MQRWIWVVCVTIAACGKPVKLTPDQIRADVLAEVKPFLGYPAYAVTDADIVEPCLAAATAEPTSHTSAVQRAWICIEGKLGEPDGLKRIEKKIADRYANPVLTRNGDKVTIDVGAPAGTIRYAINRPAIDSPHIKAWEWDTSEVIRVFKLAMDRYPDAQTYEITVLIPDKMYGPEWKYMYNRAGDRLRVITPVTASSPYVSGALGGDITKLTSANTRDLSIETRR